MCNLHVSLLSCQLSIRVLNQQYNQVFNHRMTLPRSLLGHHLASQRHYHLVNRLRNPQGSQHHNLRCNLHQAQLVNPQSNHLVNHLRV
ncbi:MAG: hypothetical protein ACK56F_05745, partial [bacterium]